MNTIYKEHIISDSSDEERTLTRYDSYNNPIEIVKQIHVSNEWIDTEKTVYAYDNVVTDYRIEVTKYIWNGKTKKWEQNYSHKKIITRNSNNYVTRISIMLYNSEEYEEIEKTEITYTDGELPADTWAFYQLDFNENEELTMQEKIRYDKIKWETSDGQILDASDGFVLGKNKIKYAQVKYEGEPYGTLTTTFNSENNRDFKCIIASADGLEEEEHSLTQTDDNGSYKEEFIIRIDMDEDGTLDAEEIMEQQYMAVTYDDHKNITEEAIYMMEENEILQEGGNKYLYTYGEHNLPTEMIIQEWNYDNGDYENMIKIESYDFYDVVTSISTLATDKNIRYAFSDHQLEVTMKGMKSYKIYNQNGMEVLGKKGTLHNNVSIPLDGLSRGIYMLVVQTDHVTEAVKFIKR